MHAWMDGWMDGWMDVASKVETRARTLELRHFCAGQADRFADRWAGKHGNHAPKCSSCNEASHDHAILRIIFARAKRQQIAAVRLPHRSTINKPGPGSV